MRRAAILLIVAVTSTACANVLGIAGWSPVDDPDGGLTTAPDAPAVPCDAVGLGIGADLGGARPFDETSAFNTAVVGAFVEPNSASILGPSSSILHAEFGARTYAGGPVGYPYVAVAPGQALVPIDCTTYCDEDRAPYPIPPDAPIEGPSCTGSDCGHHVLVVQQDPTSPTCIGSIFELFGASRRPSPGALPGWTARGSARFDGRSGDRWRRGVNQAGMPIFARLVRYDEVVRAIAADGARGTVHHALAFTMPAVFTAHAYVSPATAWAGPGGGAIPFGARVRLAPGFVVPPSCVDQARIILNTLQTYGMFMTGVGGAWFLQGAPDPRWDDDALASCLDQVRGTEFEVVRMDGIVREQ